MTWKMRMRLQFRQAEEQGESLKRDRPVFGEPTTGYWVN